MPDLRTLETFRAFVDTGSVSRAAERVCRTSPQVGRTLSALEDEVGFQLFDRSTRPLSLTRLGRNYYLQVMQVLSSARALDRYAQRMRRSLGPHVHVLTTPFVADALVIDAVGPIQRDTGMTVSIDSRTHIDMESWVGNEVFDVGVIGFPIAHPAFEIEPFITVEAMIALPSCHPLANRSVVEFSDVLEENFILLNPRSMIRRHLEYLASEQAGYVLRSDVEVNNGLIACQLVGRGRGICVTDPFIACSSGVDNIVLRKFSPRLNIEYAFYFPAWQPKTPATIKVVQAIRDLGIKAWSSLD